jgi:hypothetical protein
MPRGPALVGPLAEVISAVLSWLLVGAYARGGLPATNDDGDYRDQVQLRHDRLGDRRRAIPTEGRTLGSPRLGLHVSGLVVAEVAQQRVRPSTLAS